ncbi:hypothetical protein Glove_91g49 [Diversispora epigaea]|uniref:Phosphatidylinositol-glycan-specific phospholipase D n=1 Tax=Diversispora epigaea TaxID=1348612 RepID=A0A397J677_9GLOM|nr:hypothetical protein Glove_91g49 [Diversispora epigaea]
MSIHNEVTARAAYTFNPTIKEYKKYADYIRQNPQFVQAGSFFPDWGYQCQDNDNVAEDAHWPPFYKIATEYIREKFASGEWHPKDKHAQGVISFIYAIVSHGTADVSWHGIGIHSGFIRAMSEMNFNRNWETAHSAADLGGEFTISHMANLDYLEDKWKVPVDDLIEIYKRTNQSVLRKHIDYCVKQAYAAIQANKRFGKMFFSYYGEKSPFLIERLEDYHRGGINSMSIETHECWHGLSKWLENGPSINFLDICKTFNESFGKLPQLRIHPPRKLSEIDYFFQTYSLKLLETNGYHIDSHIDSHGVTHYEIHRQFEFTSNTTSEVTSDTTTTTFDDFDDDKIKYNKYNQNSQNNNNNNDDDDDTIINSSGIVQVCKVVPDSVIKLDIFYEYAAFGHDMTIGDFNGDGIEDIAISAPYYSEIPNVPQIGAVFIFYGKNSTTETTTYSYSNNNNNSTTSFNTTNIHELADQIIFCPDSVKQSRFGWSLVVVDLNSDGIDDLAISAPLYNALYDDSDYSCTGKVYVYFGRRRQRERSLNKLFNKAILLGNPLLFSNGKTLFGDDDDDDDDKDDYGLPQNPDLQIKSYGRLDNDWQIEAFGQVLASGDVDGDGFRDLLIGCPYCGVHNELRTPRLLQTGGVFAFHSSSKHYGNITVFDNDWSLKSPSDQNYELFGTSIEVYNTKKINNDNNKVPPIVIVGAPGYNGKSNIQMAGKIYGFEIVKKNKKSENLSNKDSSNENKEYFEIPKFDLSGTEEFQGFGNKIIAGDFLDNEGDYLMVSAQSEMHIQKFPRYGKYWQAGSVRLINMKHLKNGTLLSDFNMRLGNGILLLLLGAESASHFGNEIYWNKMEKEFWISEPFSSWESGRIFRYSFRSIVSSINNNDDGNDKNTLKIVADECMTGPTKQSRFGNKILMFDFNGDGKRDMIISSEHSSSVARLGGSVTVILS